MAECVVVVRRWGVGASARRGPLLLAVALCIVGTMVVPVGAEDKPVGIIVLKEHGVGSPALAQPYLDKLVAVAAKENNWPKARGQYFTSRSAAEAFIASEQPHYGIMSLAPFLALRKKYNLQIIGQVAVTLVGGRQYALISKTASDVGGCKGKVLASDHADDPRFIEEVVAAGAFKLADFKVLTTQRPLQTIRKVLGGEAECALIDDAQLADLAHIKEAEGLRPIWKSAELPPMPVVAFAGAPSDERSRFKDRLEEICAGEGQASCSQVAIVSLKGADGSAYESVIAAYDQ